MKTISLKVFLLFLVCLQNEVSSAQMTPQQTIVHLKKGINIGNTLDAPNGETSWGQAPIQQYYFDDYKAAGFTAVRIPITWDKHVSAIAPYAIDAEFLLRVEQVVDWGLSKGLYIIIDCHHEDFIKKDYSRNNVARFEAIWNQIAIRFKKKSSSLLFEILNEPYPLSLADLNDLNKRIFKVIRKSNSTRIIIYAGTAFSPDNELLKANIPKDKYIIANFHCYTPWAWVSGKYKSIPWGTSAEKAEIKATFDRVYKFFAPKKIPVMVNEYGCMTARPPELNSLFYKVYIENIRSHGFGSFAWDDGDDFKIYDRAGRKWIGEMQKIITSTSGQ